MITSYGQNFSSTLLTKDFNKVFSSIQKSKNTSFDQNEDFKKVINFSGKFLGEAQSFKDFRIIVFLSNNSFLSPGSEVNFGKTTRARKGRIRNLGESRGKGPRYAAFPNRLEVNGSEVCANQFRTLTRLLNRVKHSN